ncbi:MAG: hypothetical protein HY535_06960 [Chloroflexi bacterium]|nr:hypothetical protein [Chloroflexota bacterium]
MQLAPKDLYRLRQRRLAAQRAALQAHLVELQLQTLTLEMERRYGLLGKDVAVDQRTGVVTEATSAPGSPNGSQQPSSSARGEVVREPANHAHPGAP